MTDLPSNLPSRILNLLVRANYKTREAVALRTDNELLAIRNLGVDSLRTLREFIPFGQPLSPGPTANALPLYSRDGLCPKCGADKHEIRYHAVGDPEAGCSTLGEHIHRLCQVCTYDATLACCDADHDPERELTALKAAFKDRVEGLVTEIRAAKVALAGAKQRQRNLEDSLRCRDEIPHLLQRRIDALTVQLDKAREQNDEYNATLEWLKDFTELRRVGIPFSLGTDAQGWVVILMDGDSNALATAYVRDIQSVFLWLVKEANEREMLHTLSPPPEAVTECPVEAKV